MFCPTAHSFAWPRCPLETADSLQRTRPGPKVDRQLFIMGCRANTLRPFARHGYKAMGRVEHYLVLNLV